MKAMWVFITTLLVSAFSYANQCEDWKQERLTDARLARGLCRMESRRSEAAHVGDMKELREKATSRKLTEEQNRIYVLITSGRMNLESQLSHCGSVMGTFFWNLREPPRTCERLTLEDAIKRNLNSLHEDLRKAKEASMPRSASSVSSTTPIRIIGVLK